MDEEKVDVAAELIVVVASPLETERSVVEALPLNCARPETASEVRVPTEVSEEAVTPELSVVPESVPAGAMTAAVLAAVS